MADSANRDFGQSRSEADVVASIRAAVATVREAGLDPNEPAGVVALSFALRTSTRSNNPNVVESGTIEPAVPVPSEQLLGDAKDPSPPMRLARWLVVSAEDIEDAFEFGADGVDIALHPRRLPTKKADRQRFLAHVKLAVDRVAYGHDQIPASVLNALCERFDCLDQNLPRVLLDHENYFARRGKRGAYFYRITAPGLEAAKPILLGLVDRA